MELCIKTPQIDFRFTCNAYVSILVLMELCIKTIYDLPICIGDSGFNPCFNGTMYKNYLCSQMGRNRWRGFNPCFNGTMYKNR